MKNLLIASLLGLTILMGFGHLRSAAATPTDAGSTNLETMATPPAASCELGGEEQQPAWIAGGTSTLATGSYCGSCSFRGCAGAIEGTSCVTFAGAPGHCYITGKLCSLGSYHCGCY